MRRNSLFLTVFAVPLLLTSCFTDYDVAEVAPQEFLDSESNSGQTADHSHADGADCEECAEETGHTVDAAMEADQAGGPSGHSHGSAERNHGTQWFFNQPWAAPFIWGKLLRDGIVFLVMAAGIFFATGWRRKK